jgi:caffeoyl-CoA O-methyltransferase
MESSLDYRILTFQPDTQRSLVQYVRQWFAPEDEVLQAVRRNTVQQGMPEIQIRPEEGQMLQFLAALIGARRILEIGTLAGYSGIWLARGLHDGGTLTTLEFDPKHARVAREHFRLAGVADRVQIIEGEAHHTLAQMNGAAPFDMVFIDAEKEGYPAYLAWAVEHVRPGGLITVHNAFRSGKLTDEHPDEKAAPTRQMLEMMAHHPRLISTIVPVGDGIAAAMVK